MPAIFLADFISQRLDAIIGNPDAVAGLQADQEVEWFASIDQVVVGLASIKHDWCDDPGILQ